MVDKRKIAPELSTELQLDPQSSLSLTKRSRINYSDICAEAYESEEIYENDDDNDDGTYNDEQGEVEEAQNKDYSGEDIGTTSFTKGPFGQSTDSLHGNKDPNNFKQKRNVERPRNDPVYGQKSAFPGLDDPFDVDTLLYGDPEDGLEYLRMVRSEANSLPTVFKAPAQEATQRAVTSDTDHLANIDGGELKTGDTSPQRAKIEGQLDLQSQRSSLSNRIHRDSRLPARTFFSDGVVFAADTSISEDSNACELHNERDPEPSEHQTAYRTLLRHRFLLLRSTLRCSPPAPAISALDNDHPITFPSQSRRARREWRRLLLDVDPQMVQLASMDETSVLGLVELLGRSLGETVKNQDLSRIKRTGAWVWGLLGRCREVGQLGSEEVSEIRDLGKRAAKILEKSRSIENDELDLRDRLYGDVMGEANEEHEAEDDEYETTSAGDVHEKPETMDELANLEDNSTTVENSVQAADTETLEAAKLRLQQRLHDTDRDGYQHDPLRLTTAAPDGGQGTATGLDFIRSETHALLDMILTIVGEFYGQRDLLATRDIWVTDD